MDHAVTMDLGRFLEELDGGTFEAKVAHAIQETALAVANNGRVGKVVLTLDVKPTDSEAMVMVHHTLAYTRPTRRGKGGEEDKTSTPMHVGRRGVLTFMPDTQSGFDFEADRERQAARREED